MRQRENRGGATTKPAPVAMAARIKMPSAIRLRLWMSPGVTSSKVERMRRGERNRGLIFRTNEAVLTFLKMT